MGLRRRFYRLASLDSPATHGFFNQGEEHEVRGRAQMLLRMASPRFAKVAETLFARLDVFLNELCDVLGRGSGKEDLSDA
jgi:hypothetical protein